MSRGLEIVNSGLVGGIQSLLLGPNLLAMYNSLTTFPTLCFKSVVCSGLAGNEG